MPKAPQEIIIHRSDEVVDHLARMSRRGQVTIVMTTRLVVGNLTLPLYDLRATAEVPVQDGKNEITIEAVYAGNRGPESLERVRGLVARILQGGGTVKLRS